MWTHIGRYPRKERRGVVIVLAAASLVTLLVFAALAVDVGYICALTVEQQNTADAAALAGAVALQEEDSSTAMERMRDVIARNQQDQGFLSLDDQVIELGTWDSTDRTFTALDPDEWEEKAFAVRVVAARNHAPLFAAGIMGGASTDVRREAIAVGRRPCEGFWGLTATRMSGNVRIDGYNYTASECDGYDAGDNGDVCSAGEISVDGSFDRTRNPEFHMDEPAPLTGLFEPPPSLVR